MWHQSLAAQSAGECEESRREALVAMVQTTDSGNGVTFQTLGAGSANGKLFDENDEPLYIQGAAKGAHRHRHYVSLAIVRDPSAKAGRGWRIPAAEIERAVVGAVKALLGRPSGDSHRVARIRY
jgi:hypothetical protein